MTQILANDSVINIAMVGTIHRGPVPLPMLIVGRCMALISIGNLLQIYHVEHVDTIRGVIERMASNRVSICDLQSIDQLCDAVIGCDDIDDELRANIQELSSIIGLFIQAAHIPARPCGMWS
jgi:uncharacterized protein YkvS